MRNGARKGASWLATAVGRVSSVGGVAAGICLVVITLSMGFEVFMRYVLNSPTIWTFEITHYLLAATLAWSLAHGLRIGAHISVGALTEHLSHNVRRRLEAATSLFTLAVAVLLLWTMTDMVMRTIARGEVSQTLLAVPLTWPRLAAAVGFLLFVCQALVLWLQKVAARDLWSP